MEAHVRRAFLILSLLVFATSACSTTSPLALDDSESGRRTVPAERCSPDMFPC